MKPKLEICIMLSIAFMFVLMLGLSHWLLGRWEFF